ncbi:substrate-binding domain-containing protein [Desulfosporosinus sp. BICA1-9]|uniref:sugar ABC transporter substrate-binding protein n=1 Tax=Desulfosporosinus sp. BICA1-9 TaxID=1531958 RepID=UPI000A4FFF19|nr:substrate-binding domain-containing protein [Desulfosporosinus sp. BICA1-9]
MKKVIRLLSLCLVASMVLGLAGCGAAKVTEAPKEVVKKYVIGISPLTTQHEYYIGYLEGIKKAAKELNVEVMIVDPQWDVVKQTADIEDFIAKKVDAMIVSAVDPKGIKPALEKAEKAGIPVISEMTKVEGIVPLVGTDQIEGAELAGRYAGEWITKKYNGTADVAILNFPYFQNVLDRVTGFKKGLAATAPNAKIVADVDAKAKMETAMKTMEDVLQANSNVKVIFGINDDSAKGANAAFQATKLKPEDICILGFDADSGVRKLIKGNEFVKGSVAADTDIIGKACIETAIKKIKKETLPDWVRVEGAQYLVNKENIDKYLK